MAFNLSNTPLELRPLGPRRRFLGLDSLVVCTNKDLDPFGLGKDLHHPPEDNLLDFTQRELFAIFTGATFSRGRAAYAGPVPAPATIANAHSPAALPAPQEAREQRPLANDGTASSMGVGPLAGLRGLENLPVNDPQLFGGFYLPFGLGIDARHALAGCGVFNHADPVPHPLTAIDRIEQQPVPARVVAVQGRCVPTIPARRRDAFNIETRSYGSGSNAIGVFTEDAPDNSRLFLHNFKFTGTALHGLVTIGPPACAPAAAHNARHAAPNFLGAVLAEQLPDKTAQADDNCVNGSLVHRPNFDTAKGEAFVQTSEVFHVARQAIQRLHYHDLKGATGGVCLKPGEPIAAVTTCAGFGRVSIFSNHIEGLALGHLTAECDLILATFIALKLGGIAGVDRRPAHLLLHLLLGSNRGTTRLRPENRNLSI